MDLSLNNVGPAGAESLATALKTNKTLTNLYLSQNDLGPAGAESLATALKTNTTLTNLDLSRNNVGPAGAASLATALETIPCKQWSLQAGRFATKGEKPLRASFCFFDRAAVQRYGRII